MHDSGHIHQRIKSPKELRLFDGREQPNVVLRFGQPLLRQLLAKILGALRQQQPVQMRRVFDVPKQMPTHTIERQFVFEERELSLST
jgi:hypothetical protein